MNYNIKGTGLEVTPELRDYVEKKLQLVDKLAQHDSAAHTDVELEFAATESGKKYRAEFTSTISGELFRSEMRGDTLHEAIDIASAEHTHDLTKNKKKRLDVFRRSAVRVKEYLRGFRKDI